MLNDPNDDFSFSGLKTSVRYFLRDHPELLDDSAAPARSVRQRAGGHRGGARGQDAPRRQAPGRRLRHRLRRRHLQPRPPPEARRRLRARTASRCLLAEKSLCTDNAAMIGILAERKLLLQAAQTPHDTDILPNWALP